jgi:exodeoxyribonuclease V alpha subunit
VSDVTATIAVSVVHPGPTGGAVFKGYDKSGRWITAVASGSRIFKAPRKGEVWEVGGHVARHPLYGEQLYVEQAVIVRPEGDQIVKYLSTHPDFRGFGFGEAKAIRLYEKFKERLTALLDEGGVEQLSGVVSAEIAGKLVAAWHKNARESAVAAFLAHYGFNTHLASKIARCWPANAIEKLRENPYRLLALTGWTSVDRFARSLGVTADDERRLIASAEAAAYRRLDAHKDTLCDEAVLRADVRGLLRCAGATARRAIELAVEDGSLVGDMGAGYQPVGCMVMERYLATRFAGMVEAGRKGQMNLFGGEATARAVDALLRDFEGQEGITLNAEQRAAVHMAVTENISVLTGGAGVGKTTVLKAVGHVVEVLGGSVIQMALAGRAAQRMREATGREAYTIVGFLNRVGSGKIELGPNHLVVIDESSMLDLMLTYRVLKVMPKGVRLLVVGDPFQLPPIGPGLMLHVLAESRAVRVQKLVQVHRQAESTGIPSIADQVRNGIVPILPRFGGRGAGVSFIEAAPETILKHLTSLVRVLGGLGEVQVLGVTKNGPAGVKIINDTFHRGWAQRGETLPDWGLSEGEPVIFTVNDYDRELYNGSLGRVKRVFAEPQEPEGSGVPIRLTCDFDGREVGLSDNDLGYTHLAYAVTTHKAQGSQFSRVVVPITQSRLLDRTLVYTALTRAIQQVVFLGDKQAFAKAVANPPSASSRKVGFMI